MIAKKKALVAGTSATSVPIVTAIRSAGLEVGVIGGISTDVAHSLADYSHLLDYSVASDLERSFVDGGYDFLVPTCNDQSYMSCSHVAQKLQLPGYDDLELAVMLQEKALFRAALGPITKKTPKILWEGSSGDSVPDDIPLPCIVKPAEASTGKGVKVVEQSENLVKAVNAASSYSRNGNVLIESYFEGSLHSASMFFCGGASAAEFFVDEFCTSYPYAVNESNFPSRVSEGLRRKIFDEISMIYRKLGLCDGLLHTQVLLRGGDFVIVECMRRCPGDFYGRLIQHGCEYDYHAAYVSSFISETPQPFRSLAAKQAVSRQTITAEHAGFPNLLKFNANGQLRELRSMFSIGKKVDLFPNDKQGVAFYYYDSLDEMHGEVGRLVSLNGVE